MVSIAGIQNVEGLVFNEPSNQEDIRPRWKEKQCTIKERQGIFNLVYELPFVCYGSYLLLGQVRQKDIK